MKKALSLVVILSFVISACSPAFAADNGPTTKLGRGLLNIVDAVSEIPGTVMRESSSEGAATGLTAGTVKGIVNTVVRAVVGVYEVATFPLPVPENYEPILEDPKFLASE